MKALVRKEAIELGVSFGPILVAACLVWLAVCRFDEVLLSPREDAMGVVLATAAGAGLLAALLQLSGERIRGTLGFLVHRGAGVEGTFRTKAWTGAATSVLLGFVPMLVFAIVHATILGNGRVVQWARVMEYAGIATAGAAAYAIAMLAFCLRRGHLSEFLLATLGILAWLVISVSATFVLARVLGTSANHPATVAGFAALQIGTAVGLLRLAARIFARWRDRDLPLAASHHVLLLGLAIVLWIPIPLVVVGGTELEMISSFLERAPFVVRDRSNGDVLMVAPGDDHSYARLENGQLVSDVRLRDYHRDISWKGNLETVYDPRSRSFDRPLSPEFSSILRHPAYDGGWSWKSSSVAKGGRAWGSALGSMWVWAWVDGDAGVLRQFALRYPGSSDDHIRADASNLPPALPWERVVEKPSGNGRFSSSTMFLEPVFRKQVETEDHENLILIPHMRQNDGPKCIVDPEDRTLWLFDLFDFSTPLRRLELPDGDRVVDAGRMLLYDRRGLRVGRYFPQFESAVRGEKGSYEWNGSGFVPIEHSALEAGLSVSEEQADAFVELRTVHVDADVLAPAIEVRDARTNAVLLAHRYTLTENGRGTQAVLLHMTTLLRPAALNVVAFFRDTGGRVPSRGDSAVFLDSLFANRSRMWLLAISLLASMGLAGISARRARERGAVGTVITLSMLLVGALGVPAFLALELLSARKPRHGPAQSQPRAEPAVLIESVRAT